MQATAPPVSAILKRMDGDLPTEPRSRRIVLRTLLVLLQIRHVTNFVLFPVKVFKQLEDKINWPSHRNLMSLCTVIGCAFDLEDETVTAIREHLQSLLDENAGDSLKAHFAKTFGAACVDTDHMAKAYGDQAELTMLAIVVEHALDAVEDFTVTVNTPADDDQLHKTTGTYFVKHGYEVHYHEGFVFAEKDGEVLYVKFANSSASNGTILVTVKED